jgi:hypothetical protein
MLQELYYYSPRISKTRRTGNALNDIKYAGERVGHDTTKSKWRGELGKPRRSSLDMRRSF